MSFIRDDLRRSEIFVGISKILFRKRKTGNEKIKKEIIERQRVKGFLFLQKESISKYLVLFFSFCLSFDCVNTGAPPFFERNQPQGLFCVSIVLILSFLFG